MLDIIIPTFNAGTRFSRLLEKLTQQTINPQDIIFVGPRTSNRCSHFLSHPACWDSFLVYRYAYCIY
jgi:GT2 family glycosyltransferase